MPPEQSSGHEKCSDEFCPFSATVKEQSSKIDRILALLTDSSAGDGSIVEKVRQHTNQINDITRRQNLGILDHCLRQGAGTATSLIVTAIFLLLFRGFIAEIIVKGAHP